VNRYAAAGIAADAAQGRRVLVLSRTHAESSGAFPQVAGAFNPAEVTRSTRSSGRMRIVHKSGGRVVFLAYTSRSLRGQSADVVYADNVDIRHPDYDGLWPLQQAGCEVIE